jgi:hypothetical protein
LTHICSFDSNFCPESDFFKFGNKKKPNLENTVDMAAVFSPIRPIWSFQTTKRQGQIGRIGLKTAAPSTVFSRFGFFLFPNLKKSLAGQKFESKEQI